MSSNAMRVIVRAGYLMAVEPFMSTEETRYYLQGIALQPHQAQGVCLIATDGHTLGAVHDREAIIQGPEGIWRMPWKKVLKPHIDAFKKELPKLNKPEDIFFADLTHAVGREPTTVRVVFAKTAADVFNGRGIEVFRQSGNKFRDSPKVIDGTFPEWRRVVPRPVEGEEAQFAPAWFQAQYVLKLATFGQALGDEHEDGSRRTMPMSIFGTSPDAPAVARFPRSEGFAVIMPMREKKLDARKGGLPDWFDEVPAAAPESIEKPDLKVAA